MNVANVKTLDLVRVQKILANLGLCSRRKAENWLSAGRIKRQDGKILKPGDLVHTKLDRLFLDGRYLPYQDAEKLYYAYYKPKGVISTFSTIEGHNTLKGSFPIKHARLFNVGRLDTMAEGLMLITNDGTFANLVTHPRFETEKEYQVKIQRKITRELINKALYGIKSNNEYLRAKKVSILSQTKKNQWLSVVLTEGRHHEIRRIFGALGYFVLKIKRVRIGPVTIGNLSPGGVIPLTKKELKGITSMAKNYKKPLK